MRTNNDAVPEAGAPIGFRRRVFRVIHALGSGCAGR
jgi:hypothetical protein